MPTNPTQYNVPTGTASNGQQIYTSGAITSDQLAPQSPINYSTPQEPPIVQPSADALAYGLTPSQSQESDLDTSLESLNAELAGKAQDTNDAYAAQGYGTSTDANGNIVPTDPSLNDLNAQLTQLTNEAKAIPVQEQTDATGRGITAAGLAPVQSVALRNNAVAALGVSSLIAAKQGKLAYATQLVQNAITQKYGPIEAQITAATNNLNLIKNSPEATNEDKEQAQAQLDIQNQKAAALDVEKQNALDAQTETLKYAPIADAQTLQAMQQATSPAQVAQIAAAAGLSQPATGRYKDVLTKNLDGSTSIHTLDTLTGQYVTGLPSGVGAAQLNSAPSNGGSTEPPSGASTYSGVPGTTGNAAIDTTSDGYTSDPAQGGGGLTQAAIDQKALSYLTSGTLPPTGRTGLAGIQNAAISNRMAEMDAGGNLAGNKAQLKALSTTLTQQTTYLNTTQRAFNTANDTLTSLQTFMQQNGINPSQFPDFNSFSTYLKSKGIDPGAAGGYNAQIATLRQEYSQVLAKGGTRSVETDKEAAALIPDNLAPAQLAKVAAQIKIDADNVINDANKQVQSVQSQINGIISPASTTSKLPADVQTTIKQNLTFSPDGKTAYLPRAVWSTLGANMDAVLAEAKSDGVTLLIK